MGLPEARGVAFGYGCANVWEHVSLTLNKGEVSLLVGPNGAGSSTLMRCLAGWERLREGNVTFCGAPMDRLAPGERSRMAFVPDVPIFYDDLTAQEYIEFLAAPISGTRLAGTVLIALRCARFALANYGFLVPAHHKPMSN